MPYVLPCRHRYCKQYQPCPDHPLPVMFHSSPPMPAGWAKIRAEQLAAQPLCRDCGQAATEVHHDGPRREVLVSLCRGCHSRITRGTGRTAT